MASLDQGQETDWTILLYFPSFTDSPWKFALEQNISIMFLKRQ